MQRGFVEILYLMKCKLITLIFFSKSRLIRLPIDVRGKKGINFGKSALGIITGNFENVSQMQNALQAGGVIDSLSNVIDEVVNKVKKAGLINNKVATTIKQGKNIILNNGPLRES